MNARHQLAKADAHASVQELLQALHGNFHQEAQKTFNEMARKKQGVPKAWNRADEAAFQKAMTQVVNRCAEHPHPKTSKASGSVAVQDPGTV